MDDLERRLGALMHRATEGVTGADRLDEIVSSVRPVSRRPKRWSLAVAAVVALAGSSGVVALSRRSPSHPGGPVSTLQAAGPQPGVDHWHAAFGFQLCTDVPTLTVSGSLEDTLPDGHLADQAFAATGVHSHDDGMIHWHAYSPRAGGTNARLGLFFDNYDIDLTESTVDLRPDRTMEYGQAQISSGQQTFFAETCSDEPARTRVVVWSDPDDPSSATTYTSDFADIPFDHDGMAITVAFVPDGTTVRMPPWADELPSLLDEPG